jgi:hypothetical protein
MAGLVEQVRCGQGAVLVVHGEAGNGKTALLDYAAGLAANLRVVQIAGAESETELPYAGLGHVLGSLSGQLGKLPEPQRCALEIAFGLRTGAAPDRFLLGVGVLGLLTEAGAEGPPLVCVIDNAHWLDRASLQALAFAARRLSAESVLLIFATREPGTDLTGLPDLALGALPDTAVRDLLAAMVHWPLDKHVRDQVVAETHGNPRTLTELLRSLPPVLLAGGFGLPDAPQSKIPDALHQQINRLPAQTRSLLLLAAADPTGDAALVLRAAGNLGISSGAMYPAAEAGLLTFGARAVFRQPTVRSAVYQSAAAGDRRAAHGALAQATTQPGDEDRRTWHRAKAAVGPDEDVAAELERTAEQAQARGGLPAFAAFLERAVLLTADADQRSRRALAAATAMLHAGEPNGAARLLDLAAGKVPGDYGQIDVDLIRAQLAFTQSRSGDAPRLLLDAAQRLDRSDASAVRRAYLDAIRAVTFAGGLAAPGGTVTDVASAARQAPPADPARQADLLLDGLTAYLTGEYTAGAEILRQMLSGSGDDMTSDEELRWLPLACASALYLWDDATWDSLSSRHVQLARDTGALDDLSLALDWRAWVYSLNGELATAESLAAEARAVSETTIAATAVEGAHMIPGTESKAWVLRSWDRHGQPSCLVRTVKQPASVCDGWHYRTKSSHDSGLSGQGQVSLAGHTRGPWRTRGRPGSYPGAIRGRNNQHENGEQPSRQEWEETWTWRLRSWFCPSPIWTEPRTSTRNSGGGLMPTSRLARTSESCS